MKNEKLKKGMSIIIQEWREALGNNEPLQKLLPPRQEQPADADFQNLIADVLRKYGNKSNQ